MAFQEAFGLVQNLVHDFKQNEKIYLSTNYSEADVRNDFINKFFIALGWDVRHDQQKNPYEQEVRVEKPVQVAKAQKRADYTFYLSPNFRDVKFFVEAKKPFHDLENKDYFFQTVRYGWNANTPIAVLTDFEEFIILDCRYRPDINNILNYKIKRFHYSDYADQEKFKEIYFLFSREAVADNSLEKYADSLPKPKGKKKALIKGSLQKIDEAFLEELDEIRTTLAKSFKKNNTHLTSEELTEATQRTIDRLVFIKFLEDKMIEPHHYVSEFGKRKSTWEDFVTASITLDAKYNGVVFKRCLIDSRNIIEPDDKTFSKICEELSYDNTPYNFDIIPIHILGSIYERFLGKVVNATDKRVTIEEKPEVRKAGGVYYTPQYIVNYIVDNTIGKLISGKTPKVIAKMRFADIACGSGSFLITVYERLLDYHKRWYIENPEQAKKDGCILYEGVYRLSLQQKQRILTHNIYGVDLDSQAVEVTQLSLYLKLLEDETTATANDTWVMFKEKLLPNLNKNIINGNSLIGTDILDLTLQFPLLAKERGRGEVDELKLKPMDFEKAFPEVMNTGGFDAIVGNPPYVVVKGGRYTGFEESAVVIDYYKKAYETLQQQINIYVAFIEKSLRLLKTKGLFGYIIPNTILTNDYSEAIRIHLLENKTLVNLFNEGQVFKDAVVEALVIVVKNIKPDTNTIVEVKYKGVLNQIAQSHFKLNYLNRFLINSSEENYSIINKIKVDSKPLNYYCEVWRGLTTGDDSKFLSNKKVDNNHRIIIQGKHIDRYLINPEELYVNYLPKKLDRPRPQQIFEKDEKLVSKFVGKNLSFAYDTDKLYVINTACLIFNKDNCELSLKYFLSVLNSKLINFYFKLMFTDYRDAFPIIKSGHIEQLPIKIINSDSDEKKNIYDSLVKSTAQMLSAKKQLQQAKTESDKNYLERKCESLDKEIDKLVYELYGLTEEEIKIVEQK